MIKNDGRVDMIDLINGILGSLVSITAGCFLYRAWEAMLIGAIGAILTCLSVRIIYITTILTCLSVVFY